MSAEKPEVGTGSDGGSGSSSSSSRQRTLYEKDAEKTLKQRNIDIGKTVMAHKTGTGCEGDTEVDTNVYALQMQALTVYRYDVKITGIKAEGREIDFTKKSMSDAIVVNRRDFCRASIQCFCHENQDLVQNAGCIYNDLQSIMYTLKPLCTMKSGEEAIPVDYDFTVEEGTPLFGEYRIKSVRVHFQPVLDNGRFGVKLGDLSALGSDVALANRDLLQFLDIATSQEIFFRTTNESFEHVSFSTGTSYALDPQLFGFSENDSINFAENLTYLALGCQKSTHVIEGFPTGASKSRRIPALLIQPKKTPFHANCNLIDKVMALMGGNLRRRNDEMARQLSTSLKGLFVQTSHNPANIQRFPIKKLVSEGAAEKTIDIEGQGKISVQQYFRIKYNLELQHPNLPLIEVSMRFGTEKHASYYPIEVLHVIDNQRVSTQLQTPNMISQAIKKCAIPPNIFKRQIVQTAQSVHLWDSDYLQQAGITVSNDPISLRAHQLEHPDVQDGAGNQKPNFMAAVWKLGRVLQPQSVLAQYPFWRVLCFQNQQQRGGVSENELNDFLRMYKHQANQRSIGLPENASRPIFVDPREIESQFQQAAKNGVVFMLCIHGDSDDLAHHMIKKCERDFSVVSQCVKAGTVQNVVRKSQRLTVENILNKTNVKLGGINYTLPFSRIATDPDTLIIGISTNHPGGGIGDDRSSVAGDSSEPFETASGLSDESICTGPPSVVGFAANVGVTGLPFDYVGDFMYQKARREERANVIEAIVTKCVGYFKDGRNGNAPKRVLIYRNGCSEGQFPYILKYEVPLIKYALGLISGCNPECLTIVVPNKLQNMRFFNKRIDRNAKVPDQNIKPGTAIDTTVVHPTHGEFYLNSHKTLQGSARTPKYTLLHDDNNLDLIQLEVESYHLCFGHQIISSPVSLPAPVYIANEYAKRGRNLYNQYQSPMDKESFEQLNKSLNLAGTEWLANYRVNA